MKLRFKIFQHQSWLIISSLALAMGLSWNQPIRAEGSRELTASGGNRPFLEFRDDFTGGIPRRTTIQVFAREGETINLGSSAIGLGNATVNTNAIRVMDPNGNPVNCVGNGLIANRIEEENGPRETGGGNPNGYDPCIVQVPNGSGLTGIWTIEFVSPDSTSTVDPPINIDADTLPAQAAGNSYISAWDVSVRGNLANTGDTIPGRAYATYLPLNMGANTGNAGVIGNVELNSLAYIQTQRGDLYRVDLNGIDPFGFIFFANNQGFLDGPGGEPLFESVPDPRGLPDPDFHRPNQADTADNVTHKIFFNPPSGDLPTESTVAAFGNTFLKPITPPEPEVSTLTFTGVDGTAGNADPTRGGNFSFTTTEAGRYLITVDVNRDNILGNANDVVLRGRAVVGRNTVFWNGRDGAGNMLPAGEIAYNASFSMIIGDVHFPFLDPENNPLGFIIERISNPAGAVLDSFVYYNDSRFLNADGTAPAGAPNPISALLGVDSSGGAHGFTTRFGDVKGIDTWTSLVRPDFLRGLIKINKADLTIDKIVSATPLQAGNPITYTLTVRSLTNAEAVPPLDPPDTFTNIQGATVTDTIPDAITNVTWTCEPVDPATAACGTASGSGNNVSLTVDLNVGAAATITINGTISPIAAGGTVQNTATVAPPPDTFDPTRDVTDPNLNNNSSSAELTIIPGPVQPAGVKSSTLFEDADGDGQPTPGDTLEYEVIYANQDPTRNVTEFVATDRIDTSLVTFVPGSYTFAAANGAVVTANPTFNGDTDINLTSPTTLGTLPPGGSEITMTYRVRINDIPPETRIENQAVATSAGGTLENVVTDASSGTGEITQIADDGVNTGNLADDTGDDEPTIVIVGTPPTDTNADPKDLVLVKRITNALREGVPISGVNFGIFVDDPNDTNDNLPDWSALSTGAPVGVPQLDQPLISGDIVEYTIYFLAGGNINLENVRLCDPIPSDTAFVPNGFAINSGISLNQNGTTSNITNAADTDQGRFFSPLAPVDSPPCPNPSEPQGAVLVNLGNLLPIAPNNVGYVRFRIRIE
ncbi:MAG: hypothetical protein F6K47_21660 [Symploca sp. SIO2E6]|nr:hypothetical protein [Symploca sp. SIO2E6]